MRRAIWVALTVAGLAGAVLAGDWPQFRGPTRNDISPEKGLLRSFPPGGPKVLWTVPMGIGYGSAAVRDGKVYVLDRDGRNGDVLRCLDLATGKEEWRFAYSAPGRLSHDGSRSTPSVGDKYIFIIGPFGHVHCIDKATHKVVWKKHLLDDFGGRQPMWGISQSPLTYKDAVIAAPLSGSVGMVAWDQATGKELWKSKPIGPLQYASCVLTTIGGVEQVLIVGKDVLGGVDASDGKVLWMSKAHPCRIPVPDALPIGDGRVLITGGYNAGSVMIRVQKGDDGFTVTEVARDRGIGAHVHTPLLYQNHLYALCNTNERNDGLVCFDLDLKIKWKTQRNPSLDKGGMVLTGDGLIYSIDGRSGELRIIEPGPDGYKELAKAPMLRGREIWGPLCLSDGKLIVRDHEQMKCVDVKGAAPAAP